MSKSPEFEEVLQELLAFRDSKNWKQYHTLENLTKSVSIESAEMLEHFQWTSTSNLTDQEKNAYKLEVADVLTYIYYICNELEATPNELVQQKLEINKHRSWSI